MSDFTLVEGSTLYASTETREVRGQLWSHGELSRASNIEPISFARGIVRLPRDPSVVTANIRHDRTNPVGRAVSISETDEGVVATFRIADTEEGDALLADIAEGRLTRLSAEVRGIVRRGTQAISGALFGAAFVDEGAFASATLLAELADEADDTLTAASAEDTYEAIRKADLAMAIAVAVARGEDPTPLLPTEDSEPEAEGAFSANPTEPETPATNPQEDAVAEANAPESLTYVREQSTEDLSASGLFELISAARKGDPTALATVKRANDAVGMFALSDIKTSGTGSLGANTIQSNWLGELWNGDGYERKIVPLVKHADLTSFEVRGFRFDTPPTMAAWTGNKSAIASPAVAVSTTTAGIQRFAAGYDIAREFIDISAGGPVLESFLAKLVDSYKKVSDDYVLAQLVAAAGPQVDATTYPTGVGKSWGKIVQGAIALQNNNAQANFAIVAPDVNTELVFTREQDRLALLTQGGGFTGGSLSGINIVVSNNLAAGQVLVGDSRAATVFELPGAPIRVNALDIANGGVDEAVFGYVSVLPEYNKGLILIDDAV